PLGTAALGTAVYGLFGAARKLGIRNIQAGIDKLAAENPEQWQELQQDGGRVVDAVQRASNGRLSREGAADVVFNATQGPLTQAGDVQVLRDAMRQTPEILDNDLGLHLLRTQRERVTAPDVRVTTSPGIRVTYDDEAGRTVTEILGDQNAQRAFAKRVESGR